MEEDEILIVNENGDREDNESGHSLLQPKIPRTSFEEAIIKTGYGRFHYKLLALCGWALSSDAVEILSVSFALPPATCELRLSDWQTGCITAVIFLGMMVGGLFWGNLADLKGRRSVLIVSLTINAVFGLGSSFAQSFTQFIVLRFLSGIGVGGSLPVIFTYFSEFQPKSRRGSMISVLAVLWMCGSILAAGVAWLMIPHLAGIDTEHFKYTSWHIYLSVCVVPCMTSAIFYVFMPESPKFLTETGRPDAAFEVLQSIFEENNGDKLPSDYQVNRFYWNADRIDDTSSKTRRNPRHRWAGGVFVELLAGVGKMLKSWMRLFRRPQCRATSLLLVIFFTLSFGYYGLFMWFPQLFERYDKLDSSDSRGSVCSLGNTSGNGAAHGDGTPRRQPVDCIPSSAVYRDALIVAVANLPGNILTILLIDRIGRKLLLGISMSIAGLSVFLIWFLDNHVHAVIMSSVFTGVSTVGWNVLDVLSVECFPTVLRSTATGLLQAVSRIAAILGNFVFAMLVDAHCAVPMVIVSVLLVGGGSLSLFLPDYRRADIR